MQSSLISHETQKRSTDVQFLDGAVERRVDVQEQNWKKRRQVWRRRMTRRSQHERRCPSKSTCMRRPLQTAQKLTMPEWCQGRQTPRRMTLQPTPEPREHQTPISWPATTESSDAKISSKRPTRPVVERRMNDLLVYVLQFSTSISILELSANCQRLDIVE